MDHNIGEFAYECYVELDEPPNFHMDLYIYKVDGRTITYVSTVMSIYVINEDILCVQIEWRLFKKMLIFYYKLGFALVNIV